MLIKFTLKRPKAKTSVLITEFQRNGVFLKLYTGKTINTTNWSKTYQKVGSKEENHDLINVYLDNWQKELKRIINEKEANQIRLVKEEIQTELDKAMQRDIPTEPKAGEIVDFISFMDDYIKKKKAKAREIQKLQQTRKLVIIGFNLITKKSLAEWEKLSIKQKSRSELKEERQLPFNRVNLEFIETFRDYLLTAKYKVKINGEEVERHYKINYIDKQIKGLKQFLIAASSSKYKLIEKFSWDEIKSEEVEVDSVYTDFDEMQTLCNVLLRAPTEVLVRDKYIVNCFLGMRYGDFNNLEPHMFRERTIKGKKYIVYTGRAQKTDKKVEFVLHPVAVAILRKYDFAMPKLSATEFNKVIKRVAFKAGLLGLERIREVRGTEKIVRDVPKWELMSSHTPRRSFCTNFYVEGVAIAAIMSISGHTTEEEFRKYIKKPYVRIEVVATQVCAIRGIEYKEAA